LKHPAVVDAWLRCFDGCDTAWRPGSYLSDVSRSRICTTHSPTKYTSACASFKAMFVAPSRRSAVIGPPGS
jgi:hypothetical protein